MDNIFNCLKQFSPNEFFVVGITVNRLLFRMNLFCNLLETYRFMTTDLYNYLENKTPETAELEEWFAARNIFDDRGSNVNLA